MLLSSLERLLDRAVCVIGAVLLSQGPEFMQQYYQRLGGHLAEARRQVDALGNAARAAGMTVESLAHQASSTGNPAVSRLGEVVTDSLLRTQSLQSAHDALATASSWSRPFVFIRHLDPDIAVATWSSFRPAVPTTAEGAVYAAAGILLALAAYHSALAAIRLGLRRRRGHAPAQATP